MEEAAWCKSTSPKDGSYVKESPISVTWTVDGVAQANTQALTLGANTLSRSAQDAAGNVFTHTITVNLGIRPPRTAPS